MSCDNINFPYEPRLGNTTPGGGGLEYWIETEFTNGGTTGTKLIPDTTNTNQDIVLSPKGNGSIISIEPDNTSTGGNNRGDNAVDLQRVRSSADQVASASYSVIVGGVNNEASGGNSFIGGGQSNTAEDLFNVVVGGQNNTASSESSTIAGGYTNVASNDYSTIAGGRNNTASGANSIIAGGQSNTASGTHSFVGGGQSNTANNFNSSVIGGSSSVASGAYSVSAGISNTAPSYAEIAFGSYATTYTPASTSAVDSADRLFVLGNGTGTGARSNALVVYKSGAVEFNEAFTFPTADGTAGQVLQTDGSGVVTWETVGGGLDYWTESEWSFGGGTGTKFIPSSVNTNQSITLSPKGNGSITAHQPDGTTAGGNVRGSYAVDFQMVRDAITQIASGSRSAIISGRNNTASGNDSIIGAGLYNVVSGTYSGVFSGYANSSSPQQCFIGGGYINTITSTGNGRNAIAGGERNAISGSAKTHSIIGSGYFNTLSASHSGIVGGNSNGITSGNYGFIGGGQTNVINIPDSHSVIVGGLSNTMSSFAGYSFIGGGNSNNIVGVMGGGYHVIGGGNDNSIYSASSAPTSNTVGGGQNNDILIGSHGFIGGGFNNELNDVLYATISGGNGNTVQGGGDYSGIGGGLTNNINSSGASNYIAGGRENAISSDALRSFIGAGYQNVITGANYSAILGGDNNQIQADAHNGTIIGNYNQIEASAERVIATGYAARGRRYGENVWTVNQIGDGSDNQTSKVQLKIQTTDATPTEMFLGGVSSNRLEIQSNSSTLIKYRWIRRNQTDGKTTATTGDYYCLVEKGATDATVSIVAEWVDDSVTPYQGNDGGFVGGTDDIDLTADTTNGTIKFTATGLASKDIVWLVMAEIMELTD